MKIKKMKLLSLFFVLASTVAVKTSFNPVCVQAMRHSNSLERLHINNSDYTKIKNNLTPVRSKSVSKSKTKSLLEIYNQHKSFGFADIDAFKYVECVTAGGFNELMKKSFNNYCQNSNNLKIAIDQIFNPASLDFHEWTYDEWKYGFNIYRPMDKSFEYKKSSKKSIEKTSEENSNEKIISDNKFDFKSFGDYLFSDCESADYLNKEDIINFNFKKRVKYVDQFDFEEKEKDQVRTKVVDTMGNIAEDGAISLCKWIEKFLPYKAKYDIGINAFFGWTEKEKKDIHYVCEKLVKYIYEVFKKTASDKKLHLPDDVIVTNDLIFSIDFTNPSLRPEMHYFYDMRINNEEKLVYLGSVKYLHNGGKRYYRNLEKALNSYLFYCGRIKGYKVRYKKV